jgi:hypothetical protein
LIAFRSFWLTTRISAGWSLRRTVRM